MFDDESNEAELASLYEVSVSAPAAAVPLGIFPRSSTDSVNPSDPDDDINGNTDSNEKPANTEGQSPPPERPKKRHLHHHDSQSHQHPLQQPDDHHEILKQQHRKSAAAGEIMFEDIIVRLVGSVVRLDVKSKAYTSYIILITCYDIERWRIEKRYSAFHELDEKVSFLLSFFTIS